MTETQHLLGTKVRLKDNIEEISIEPEYIGKTGSVISAELINSEDEKAPWIVYRILMDDLALDDTRPMTWLVRNEHIEVVN